MKRVGQALAFVVVAGLGWWWLRATPGERPGATAANLVMVTIDTLRADRVGAYGLARARTPTIDRLAREGARFDRAYAPAPITLTSHATLLTGRNPPGHGARHNGIPVVSAVPTLAERLKAAGLQTAAFVAAFPLDRRFGLSRGFDTYDDQMGRGPDGRTFDERSGAEVIDHALAWLRQRKPGRFFLWVHLFEPHAPYGAPPATGAATRPVLDRYDDEIAEADRQTGRLVEALGADLATTLVVVAADHGEAFGEHGERSHSVFVYDTTLRVPLVMRGPGIDPATLINQSVGLVDVFPTTLARLGVTASGGDGLDVSSALEGRPLPIRSLYAESFAPLVDFGWAPLRAMRTERWKYIAAPSPELFDLVNDPSESTNVHRQHEDIAQSLAGDVERVSGPELSGDAGRPADQEAARRLGALGYVGGGGRRPTGRPDPKDRREQAARLAQITSGELHGEALIAALRASIADDPASPQAHLRLGFALLDRKADPNDLKGDPNDRKSDPHEVRNECREAEPHFTVAINAGLPSADPYLGRASCEAARGDLEAARATLERANRVESGNPVVLANLGLVESNAGRHDAAITWLGRTLEIDAGFHEARFNLALTYARAGRRADAEKTARDLLARLPANAPQRAEVLRLIHAIVGKGFGP